MRPDKEVIELFNPIKIQCPNLLTQETILLKEIIKQNTAGVTLALKFFSKKFLAGSKEIEKKFIDTGSHHRIAPDINIYSGIIVKTAVEFGNLETLGILYADEAGADFNQVTAGNLWEICLSHFQTHQSIFDFLLEKNVPFDEQTLRFAMRKNNITAFEKLFAKVSKPSDIFLEYCIEFDTQEIFEIVFNRLEQSRTNIEDYINFINTQLKSCYGEYKIKNEAIFQFILEKLIKNPTIIDETKKRFIQYCLVVTVCYGSPELLKYLLSYAKNFQLDINQIVIPSDLARRSIYTAGCKSLLDIALTYANTDTALILLLAGSQFDLNASLKMLEQNWNSAKQKTSKEITSYLYMAEIYKLSSQLAENAEYATNTKEYLNKARENSDGYSRYLNHLLKFDSQPPLIAFQFKQLLHLLNSKKDRIVCLDTTFLYATNLVAHEISYQNAAFYFAQWLYHATYVTNDDENTSPRKVYQHLLVCASSEVGTNSETEGTSETEYEAYKKFILIVNFFRPTPQHPEPKQSVTKQFEAQLHCLFFQILHTTAQHLQAQQKPTSDYWIAATTNLNINDDIFIKNPDQTSPQKASLLNEVLFKLLQKFSQITKEQPTTVNNFLLTEFSTNPHIQDSVFKEACKAIFRCLHNNSQENEVTKTLQGKFAITLPKPSQFIPPSPKSF